MEGDIPLTLEGMSASAGNEQAASGAEGPAFNVLDDNHDTMWHTAWDGSERDVQWISISLGEARLVDGLRYLPRKSNENGLITKYEIYVSQDNGRTYQKACEGDWEADHYNLGDNEIHLAFTTDDMDAAHKKHREMDCICFENPEMGIYFIHDPDGYWIEIVPVRAD